MTTETTTACCPPFNPDKWDNKTIEWTNRKFVKDRVCTLFYMPLNFGGKMKKLMKTLDASGTTMQDGMILTDHTSQWNMDIYLDVDKNVPGLENVTLSGRYYCKVYEGLFRDSGKWCKDYESALNTKGMKHDKLLMWYTTCPKCAKKYGKNYVVILSKLG